MKSQQRDSASFRLAGEATKPKLEFTIYDAIILALKSSQDKDLVLLLLSSSTVNWEQRSKPS